MPPDPRRTAWVRLLPLLLALLALGAMPVPGAAEEGDAPKPPSGADGADEPDEPDEPAPGDQADDKVPFVEEVNQAIDRGVAWLLARPEFFTSGKTPMAYWGYIYSPTLYGGGTGPGYGHPAGPTALALYTLLKCGVDPKHPTIVEGFNWLRTPHEITEKYDRQAGQGYSWSHRDKMVPGSYELSAMILAVTAKYDTHKRTKNTQARRRKGKLKITDPEDLAWLQDMVASLVERRGTPEKGSRPQDKLGWRYNVPEVTLSRGGGRGGVSRWTRQGHAGHGGNADLSSSQLAALALFSAHQFGIKCDRQVWLDLVEFTLAHQEKDGPEHERFDPLSRSGGYGFTPKVDHARGFMYMVGSQDGSEGIATGSMTACGVANLLLAKDVLLRDRGGEKEWGERGYDKKVETAIWDGLAWLDLNWSSFENPRSRYGYHVYYLYCVERAMDLLNKNLIGKRLWYTEGARSILDRKVAGQAKVRVEKNREVDAVHWDTNSTHDPKDVLDTCFALLFLKRATKDIIPGGVPVTGGEGAPVDNR